MAERLADHQRLLFEIGRLMRGLEDALSKRGAAWHVVETDFQKPFTKLTRMISAATERGLMRESNLDWKVMKIMCWVKESEWTTELLNMESRGIVLMGYNGYGHNMYRDGERISVSEYAKKHNTTFAAVKQRILADKMLTAAKDGERWSIDSEEPFI